MMALGAGAFALGALCHKNTRDEKKKSIAATVMVIGIAILAGGAYQSYSDYQNTLAEQRFQAALGSIPTVGKLGELFAVFREKMGATRENFLGWNSSEVPAKWGFDPEKGHLLSLQANYFFASDLPPQSVSIELIHNLRDSQEVISHVEMSSELFSTWIQRIIPKVISELDSFLIGQKIHEENFTDSSLQHLSTSYLKFAD